MSDIKISATEEELLILEKRTNNLSQKMVLSEDSQTEKDDYFLFEVNNIKYAIDKSYIQELHSDIKIKKVPSIPSFITGIVNIRGEIVSLNDLSSFLGNSSIKNRDIYQMIRVKKDQLDFGILIDEALDIVKISKKEIFPFKHSDNLKIDKYMRGVTSNMVNVIDIEKIFSDPSMIISTI